MSFEENIQSLRKKKGLSQENLAEVIGVSRQAVSKWESGQSYPDVDKLVALSDFFKVTLDELLKGSNPAPVEDTIREDKIKFEEDFYPRRYRCRYEYKSKRTLFNMPLVHINIGRGIHVAKGVIAIGTISKGFLSIGMVALGGVCIGVFSLGLISIACFALSLLLSIGSIAIGTAAIGAIAVGVLTMGALSIGMFSMGACAIAKYIAIGSYASGHIAIGETVKGAKTIIVEHNKFNAIGSEQVTNLIKQEYPKLWKPIIDWLTLMFN